jgi:hypothetical protein
MVSALVVVAARIVTADLEPKPTQDRSPHHEIFPAMNCCQQPANHSTVHCHQSFSGLRIAHGTVRSGASIKGLPLRIEYAMTFRHCLVLTACLEACAVSRPGPKKKAGMGSRHVSFIRSLHATFHAPPTAGCLSDLITSPAHHHQYAGLRRCPQPDAQHQSLASLRHSETQ